MQIYINFIEFKQTIIPANIHYLIHHVENLATFGILSDYIKHYSDKYKAVSIQFVDDFINQQGENKKKGIAIISIIIVGVVFAIAILGLIVANLAKVLCKNTALKLLN